MTKYRYISSFHLNNYAKCICGVFLRFVSLRACMVVRLCCVCSVTLGYFLLLIHNVVIRLAVGMFLYVVVAVRRNSSSMYLTRLHPFQELISKYNTFDTHNNSFYKVPINYFFMLFSTTMCVHDCMQSINPL